MIECPVCDRPYCETFGGSGHWSGFDCERCGRFRISGSVIDESGIAIRGGLNGLQKAALSHQLRTTSHTDAEPLITSTWLDEFREKARLPSPSAQASTLIRLIGEQFKKTGGNYVVEPATGALVGSPGDAALRRLFNELVLRSLIIDIGTTNRPNRAGSSSTLKIFSLSLDGWDRFEKEERGELAAGKYGFIALKFGDAVLDAFLKDVIQPGVKQGIGYDVVDMRSISKAGIIDNIMRAQIRDSAFVLVDLTHDNAGAYWEAGYAEGLNKPVIYICERTKFDAVQTHFDTNHCTTVKWSEDDPENFVEELVATLRRSLNLFPTK